MEVVASCPNSSAVEHPCRAAGRDQRVRTDESRGTDPGRGDALTVLTTVDETLVIPCHGCIDGKKYVIVPLFARSASSSESA